MNDLQDLVAPGGQFRVRVTPRARRNAVICDDRGLRVMVTAPAHDGQANDAVVRLLAKALGVAPSRLTLLRGTSARDKLFRLDQPRSSR
ncbi:MULTISPECIES: DUF167 domain-containing protein [unclassified Paracoccus (in: a-proteobacteria)]|uniref:DUF167 domain-containing protein n=1 Tax=unclassified Paracoccus (in: a-proteobacteria) TaxID=2688777 RepID=UPI0012B1D57B|nr:MULTISPECIES: DUF167 domain-containing protein [unclassified Paracoccus (in: a-proteobacteria)]UXU75144.1 DUF167 domain-containing protein [Paracoccus sp. SMMA_5]UXU81046.1 DUF167 domain-containing protein [Paracoccus sp. SMMA_5_TC]